MKPPPSLHRPLVSSLLVVSAPVTSQGRPKPRHAQGILSGAVRALGGPGCGRPSVLGTMRQAGLPGLRFTAEPWVMAPARREGGSILQGPSHSPLLQARAGGPVQKDAPPVSLGSSGLTSLLGGVTYLIQEGQVLGRG